MPANVTLEYLKAEEKYRQAKTRVEKIRTLEEMLRTAPTHKGAEKLRAQIKSKIAKLKSQKETKAGGRITTIPKQGDAQVCIIGLTNSGKSTLLSEVTNAKPKISHLPFTTTKPQIGTIEYEGVRIQLIEIPSKFTRQHMSIAQNADALILKYIEDKEKAELEKIIRDFKLYKPILWVRDVKDNIKDEIWSYLGLIRVYTKEARKKPEKKPIVLKKGTTVEKAVKEVHKDFLKHFRFVRIWGKSAKFPGEKVGLEHKLKDKDIMEIHA